MWLTHPLTDALGSGAKVDVLRRLCEYARPHTGRELARAVGRTHTQVQRALAELEASGLVTAQRRGPSRLFELRGELAVVEGLLKPLFEGERALEHDVARELSDALTSAGAASVILYGSMARADARPGSDVDVLVVVERKSAAMDARIADACRPVEEQYGVAVSALPATISDLRRWQREGEPLWRRARDEGKVIAGRDFEELEQLCRRPATSGRRSSS